MSAHAGPGASTPASAAARVGEATLPSATRHRRRALSAWIERHPLAADLALLGTALLLAAALRVVLLGDVPYGLHPDEAQVGTDAADILNGDPLGPYTSAALGQPSGHAYVATPFVAVLGHEVLAVRLPLTLLALAAIPLLYAFARVTLGRPEAFFAAVLLATSYWHLLYSRIAHWSISYGTVALAIALCVVLALQHRSRGWMIAAGAITGIGIYTYNVYGIAVIALAVAIAIISVVCVSRPDRRWWLRELAIASAVAFVIAIPLLVVIANPGSEFWDHAGDYGESGLLRADHFRDASLAGKIELAAAQAKRFAATYTYDATLDVVDGNGLRPVFDPLTLALLAGGLVASWFKRRNPAIIIALCCIIIIPLPAVLQRGSVMRQPLAAAPFAMLIAALPLAWAWRARLPAGTLPRGLRVATVPALRVAVVCVVAGIAALTVRDYFWTWRDAQSTGFVYHDEVTSSALYMRDLPDDAFVYFYSERHPLSLETVEFLAPDTDGVDRSDKFAIAAAGSIEAIRRDRPAVLVLLEPYLERGLIAEVWERYPGGRTVVGERDGRVEFIAYELAAER